MVIYRVQDSEGRGPWRPGFSRFWVEDRSEVDLARLRAIQDELPGFQLLCRPGFHYGVGCLSHEQLRRWFTPREYERLLGFRFQAVELEVDAILFTSEVQCFFQRFLPLAQQIKPFSLY